MVSDFISFSQNTEADTSRINQANAGAFKLYGVDANTMLEIGSKALQEARDIQYEKGVANSFNTIALAHLSLGNYDKSVINFLAALKIYEELNINSDQANILSNIGVVYYYLDDHSSSLEYHEKAFEKRKILNDSSQIAKSLNNMGIAYKNLHNSSEALSFYQKALTYKQLLKDSIGVSHTLNNIGNIHLELENYDQALSYFEQSFNLDKLLDQRYGIATSYLNMGLVKMSLGNLKEAEALFHRGLLQANEIGAKHTRLLAYHHLSEVYKLQKKFENALKYNFEWMRLNDSINSTEKNRIIGEIESKYQNERIIIENKLLKEQQKGKDEQIAAQRNLILGGILLAALFILFTIYFLRSYRFKNSFLVLTQKKNEEITDQNRLISDQKEELEEINEMKNKMLSILSHDIKGPFNNFHSILSMANEGHVNDLELRELLQLLSVESNNVKEMISNILEWVKSQMGGSNVLKKEFSLRNTIQELIPVYSSLAENKGLKIQVKVKDDMMIYADENLTKIIIRNLISNAIKFTNEGVIEINSDFVENEAFISVVDSGVGIEPENITKIFTEDQFTTKGTSNEEGSGIGLLLVKEFVMKNGGRLDVKSKIGIGTTFSFTAPLYSPA